MKNNYVTSLRRLRHPAYLDALKAYAVKHDVPIITDEGLRFLQQLIRLKDVKHVLEVGTAIGYSALAMARVNEQVKITTIERDPHMIEAAKKHFSAHDRAHQITLIEGDALAIELPEKSLFDLVFIDGAKAQSIKFFEKYEHHVKSKGIIVTDNLLFHGMVGQKQASRNLNQLLDKIDQFNRYILERDDYDTMIYEVGDGMSLSIKKR